MGVEFGLGEGFGRGYVDWGVHDEVRRGGDVLLNIASADPCSLSGVRRVPRARTYLIALSLDGEV